VTITHWRVDPERYRTIPFLSDGITGEELNLRLRFAQSLAETSGGS